MTTLGVQRRNARRRISGPGEGDLGNDGYDRGRAVQPIKEDLGVSDAVMGVLGGIVSDLLNAFTELGSESLRWSLVICLVFNLISALLYLIAGRTIKDDLAEGRAMS